MLRCSLFLIAGLCVTLSGCHDGPLYALKHANPYFVREWKKDEALGVTDFQRRKELELLVRTVPAMPPEERTQWLVHLNKIMANDPSSDMRHLAVRATEAIQGEAALTLVEEALTDESLKVRMAACDVLGNRPEPQAAELLAKTAGESTNADVRQAALRSIARHRGQLVSDSLKLALADRDPAIRLTAIESLEEVTGEKLGNDPEVWVAYLEGRQATPDNGSITDRLKDLF